MPRLPYSYPLFTAIFIYRIALLLFPLALSLLQRKGITIIDWPITTLTSPILFTVIVDPFGCLLSTVVLFIAANVIVFAHSYISTEIFLPRFTILVLLFVASINFLIFIPNLISLLLGWDGLGLVSFLLVIYYQNASSLGAGIITALTNRIGDALILLSIGWIINLGYWTALTPPQDHEEFIYLAVALVIAAITKSAQIPFSSWLPAAIAAPTPVSALVHSSTLVTAGIFLLFRFYPFIATHPPAIKILLVLATLTCLIAGIRANTECDIKKIIALSTLSQLGVIITRLGLAIPLLAFFHLITHALFKALLFLCAGTLIHLHHHSQDLRLIGALNRQTPSIVAAITISNFALCGAPFLAGFYSKDAILEFALARNQNLVILLLLFFATGLTVRYTIRFLITVVWGPSNGCPLQPTHDRDMFCTIPTLLLSLFSVFGGAALNWALITPIIDPILPPTLKAFTLVVCFIGAAAGFTIRQIRWPNVATRLQLQITTTAICNMWFLAPLSSQHTLPAPIAAAHLILKTLDQGWEEAAGGQGSLHLGVQSPRPILHTQRKMITVSITLSLLLVPLFICLVI